ncbi:MAG: DivIVA domain-containing protein [Antricoccus sp.]
MPLTPADVHNVAFKKPPVHKRGYDDEEVDAFLDLVEAELARLIEENADLRNQLSELEAQRSGSPAAAPEQADSSANSNTGQYSALHNNNEVVGSEGHSSATGQYSTLAQNAPHEQAHEQAEGFRAPAAAQAPEAPAQPQQLTGSAGNGAMPAPSGANDHEKASRILELATETADRHLSEAREQADKHVAEATAQAAGLRQSAQEEHDRRISDAKSEADKHVTEARTSAAALLSESQAKAHEVEQSAQTRAAELSRAAEQKQSEILRALDERKSGLERRIEVLHTFETSYRSRIQGYLRSQLTEIEELPPLEPSDDNGAHSIKQDGKRTAVSGFAGGSDAGRE